MPVCGELSTPNLGCLILLFTEINLVSTEEGRDRGRNHCHFKCSRSYLRLRHPTLGRSRDLGVPRAGIRGSVERRSMSKSSTSWASCDEQNPHPFESSLSNGYRCVSCSLKVPSLCG